MVVEFASFGAFDDFVEQVRREDLDAWEELYGCVVDLNESDPQFALMLAIAKECGGTPEE